MENHLSSAPHGKIRDPTRNYSIGRKVTNAVKKLQGPNGISIYDLKKFLRESRKMAVGFHGGALKLALKNAVNRGVLIREGGNYKVKEARRRPKGAKSTKAFRRRRSRRRPASPMMGHSRPKERAPENLQ